MNAIGPWRNSKTLVRQFDSCLTTGLCMRMLPGLRFQLQRNTQRFLRPSWNKTERSLEMTERQIAADLIFSFQETLDEIDAMSKIGTEFLTAETQEAVFPEIVALLESIRAAR